MLFLLSGVCLFYDLCGYYVGVINELCWGLEEQGVFCQIIIYDGGGDVVVLGVLVVRSLFLWVGIGFSVFGEIVFIYVQLLVDVLLVIGYVIDSDDYLCMFGVNVGQLVKVLLLSERN